METATLEEKLRRGLGKEILVTFRDETGNRIYIGKGTLLLRKDGGKCTYSLSPYHEFRNNQWRFTGEDSVDIAVKNPFENISGIEEVYVKSNLSGRLNK